MDPSVDYSGISLSREIYFHFPFSLVSIDSSPSYEGITFATPSSHIFLGNSPHLFPSALGQSFLVNWIFPIAFSISVVKLERNAYRTRIH